MSTKILFEDLFSESSCKMLSGLNVFRALNWNTIEYFEFFKEIKNIKSITLFFWNGITWKIENDEFVQTTEVFNLFWVCDFVVSNVELHQTSKLREVFESIDQIVFKRKLQ